MSRDLTTGSVWKHIFVLAVTTFLGLCIQQIYSLADTAIVGQVLGADALAGVGATGSLYFMIIFFCIGICTGFSIPVSREFGAGNLTRMRSFVANGVWLSIAVTVIISLVASFFCRDFLLWLKTPADILDNAYRYFVVISAGLACTVFYNLLANLLKGLGDTRTPLFALIISSLINIVLDYTFMKYLGMGVDGAALATVLSQGLSGLFCLIILIRRYEIMHIRKPEWKMDSKLMKHLLSFGLPMGLQYSITAIGNLILQSAINSFGAAAVTGMTVAQRITFFFNTPLESTGQIMAPFTAQNMGAKTYTRIREGLFKTTLAGFACSAIVFPILFFFGKDFIHIFLPSPTEQVIRYAYTSILCTACTSFLLVIVNSFRFTIQGIGHTSLAMVSGALEMVGRIFAALVLAKVLGFTGVALGSAIAWFLADCFLIPTFFVSYRKLLSPPKDSVSSLQEF